MDPLQNDQPNSNGVYNNSVGEEINSVPSNEKGEEINDAVRISKRSKRIARTITGAIAILSMIALFAPAFSKACSVTQKIEFAKLFTCEIVELIVEDSGFEYTIRFSKLDEETQMVIEGNIDVKEKYEKDVYLIIYNDNLRIEKIITNDIVDNKYKSMLGNLDSDTTYKLTVKIADETVLEQDITTNKKAH